MIQGKIKLITGLGNKDKNKVKDLVLLWAKAGADIFDTSCGVLTYIQEAFVDSGLNLDDYTFCVSIPIEGDKHGKKAKIDYKKCRLCGKCKKYCIENAINPPSINKLKCIGCMHCVNECPYGAITIYDDKNNDFNELLKTNAKLDMVEVHISIENKTKIKKEYKKILDKLKDKNCSISVCLNREYFSNNEAIKLLSELKEITKEREFIVQADGNSMNSANDELKGTIETVAFGILLNSKGFDVVLSGGTNSHSAKLAKDANLKCAIGYGSFARKLVDNIDYDKALETAKEFIRKTKEYIND